MGEPTGARQVNKEWESVVNDSVLYRFLFASPVRSKVLLGFIIGMFFTFSLSNYVYYEHPMQVEGISTQGEVTARQISEGLRGPIYNVTYSWEVGGRRYSSSVNREGLFHAYQVGDSLTLVYHSDSPHIAETEDYLKSGLPERLAAVAAVFIVVSLGFMLFSVFKARRSSGISST